jgi:hypothetical protein
VIHPDFWTVNPDNFLLQSNLFLSKHMLELECGEDHDHYGMQYRVKEKGSTHCNRNNSAICIYKRDNFVTMFHGVFQLTDYLKDFAALMEVSQKLEPKIIFKKDLSERKQLMVCIEYAMKESLVLNDLDTLLTLYDRLLSTVHPANYTEEYINRLFKRS